MSRGYRSIVLAALGWLALTAAVSNNSQSPQQRGGTNQTKARDEIRDSAATIANAINNTIVPSQRDAGCKDRKDNRYSDLCAQWKAADAANWAAYWAGWSVLIGVIGAAFLVWTLAETRATARRQLRAYISVIPSSLKQFKPGETAIATFKINNGGQTPAYGVSQFGAMIVRELPLLSDPLDHVEGPSGVKAVSVVHGRESISGLLEGPDKITQEEFDAVRKGEDHALYLIGTVPYRDTFGRKRETEFCFYVDKAGLGALDEERRKPEDQRKPVELMWSVAPLHNEAT